MRGLSLATVDYPLQHMSQAPKNFIILVETLERELPASLLLGTEFASRGHIELDEVNGLLQSYVTCKVRDEFVPAVVDEVGSKLQ